MTEITKLLLVIYALGVIWVFVVHVYSCDPEETLATALFWPIIIPLYILKGFFKAIKHLITS